MYEEEKEGSEGSVQLQSVDGIDARSILGLVLPTALCVS